MCQDIGAVRDAVRRYVGRLSPQQMTTKQAADHVAALADIARAAEGGLLLLMPRAAEGQGWLRAGHRTSASWLADLTGNGLGDAIRTVETAERVSELDATADALRRGALSSAQARTIADAATKNPSAEGELLRSAATDSLEQLKERARAAKEASAGQRDRTEREEQIRRTRYLRSWTDEEGAFRLDAKLTAESGAALLGAVESRAKVFFDAARDEGIREASAAYMADALVDLCTAPAWAPTRRGEKRSAGAPENGDAGVGGRPRSSQRPPSLVHLRVDLAALKRGALAAGEMCEIAGVGPVSLATATNLIGDSWVKLLVRDGVDVQSVVHFGRTIPAALQTALEERDPCCVVPGCGVVHHLEIDHWRVPFAEGGATALWNLARLCTHHHRLKTHRGWQLLGGPGKWEFVPPGNGPPDPGDKPRGRAKERAPASEGVAPRPSRRRQPASLFDAA